MPPKRALEEEYEVDQILDIKRNKNGSFCVRVDWEGYPEDKTYYPYANFAETSAELIYEWWIAHPKRHKKYRKKLVRAAESARDKQLEKSNVINAPVATNTADTANLERDTQAPGEVTTLETRFDIAAQAPASVCEQSNENSAIKPALPRQEDGDASDSSSVPSFNQILRGYQK